MASTPFDRLVDNALDHAKQQGVDLDAVVTVRIRPDLPTGSRATWQTPPADARLPPNHHDAFPGDEVKMPNRAAIRLGLLGYVDGVDPAQVQADVAEGTDTAIEPAALEHIAPRALVPQTAPIQTYDPAALGAPAGNVPATAPAAATPPNPPEPVAVASQMTDDELDSLLGKSVGDVTAHLNQFAGDADRVQAAELARGAKRRVGILRATGMTDADLEALAADEAS